MVKPRTTRSDRPYFPADIRRGWLYDHRWHLPRGDHLIEKGDTTDGRQSARMILQDPTVEMAVLERRSSGRVFCAGRG